jgi:lipoprotein-anchoring transpeptidase ErfK/SrfK
MYCVMEVVMKIRGIIARALAVFAAAVFITSVAVAPAMATTTTGKLVLIAGPTQFPATITTSSPSLITSSSAVNTATVIWWVNTIGNTIDRSVLNVSARLNSAKKRVDITSRVGYHLDRATSITMVENELWAHVGTGTFNVLTLPVTVTKPKPMKNKIILERLTVGKGSKNHGFGYLYNYDGTLQKAFRTAIGMPAYPTPTGSFHIGRKVKMPTWNNPHVAWSAGMPNSMQGVNSPLGTRAMYVYTSRNKDTGVRFHGVPSSENGTIGHAASHGCLRMQRKNVEALFPLVPINTIVFIIK